MPPQNKEAIVRPRTVTMQTTTDRRGERRYIVTGDEQLLPFGRYLQSEGSGANLKRPAHSRNARDDGTDLGTRSVQGTAL
jgi:hypothetical protein